MYLKNIKKPDETQSVFCIALSRSVCVFYEQMTYFFNQYLLFSDYQNSNNIDDNES